MNETIRELRWWRRAVYWGRSTVERAPQVSASLLVAVQCVTLARDTCCDKPRCHAHSIQQHVVSCTNKRPSVLNIGARLTYRGVIWGLPSLSSWQDCHTFTVGLHFWHLAYMARISQLLTCKMHSYNGIIRNGTSWGHITKGSEISKSMSVSKYCESIKLIITTPGANNTCYPAITWYLPL